MKPPKRNVMLFLVLQEPCYTFLYLVHSCHTPLDSNSSYSKMTVTQSPANLLVQMHMIEDRHDVLWPVMMYCCNSIMLDWGMWWLISSPEMNWRCQWYRWIVIIHVHKNKYFFALYIWLLQTPCEILLNIME